MSNICYRLGVTFHLLIITTLAVGQQAKNQDVAVMAYYAGRLSQLDSFEAQNMTHLIYCFGHLQGNRFHLTKAIDTALIQQMMNLKTKNPALKVTLSIGGWGGCATCSDVFATKKGRRQFARSVKKVSDYFHSDGIDLDWEYPAIQGYPGHTYAPEDKEHFTTLVKQLRKKLGRNAIISFAAGGFKKYLDESVNWKEVMPYVNYINLMTYDLVSGYSTRTGHHTALYSSPQQGESTDNAVQYLLKKGVPPGKLVIGAAFYARIWQNVSDTNNGRYQSGTFKGAESYSNFSTCLSADSGYAYYWDDTAKAPYAYNAAQKLYATFDDKRSIQLKTQYVIDQHLGGIMFWQLSEDAYVDGLLEAINAIKRKYTPGQNNASPKQ